jgi:hypothetical protein
MADVRLRSLQRQIRQGNLDLIPQYMHLAKLHHSGWPSHPTPEFAEELDALGRLLIEENQIEDYPNETNLKYWVDAIGGWSRDMGSIFGTHSYTSRTDCHFLNHQSQELLIQAWPRCFDGLQNPNRLGVYGTSSFGDGYRWASAHYIAPLGTKALTYYKGSDATAYVFYRICQGFNPAMVEVQNKRREAPQTPYSLRDGSHLSIFHLDRYNTPHLRPMHAGLRPRIVNYVERLHDQFLDFESITNYIVGATLLPYPADYLRIVALPPRENLPTVVEHSTGVKVVFLTGGPNWQDFIDWEFLQEVSL